MRGGTGQRRFEDATHWNLSLPDVVIVPCAFYVVSSLGLCALMSIVLDFATQHAKCYLYVCCMLSGLRLRLHSYTYTQLGFTYMSMHPCTFTYTSLTRYMCRYTYMYICVYTSTFDCVYAYTSIYICLHISIHASLHVHLYMFVCICA